MQTITYGRTQDGELDILALGEADNAILNKTLGGYTVDSVPWCE